MMNVAVSSMCLRRNNDARNILLKPRLLLGLIATDI